MVQNLGSFLGEYSLGFGVQNPASCWGLRCRGQNLGIKD